MHDWHTCRSHPNRIERRGPGASPQAQADDGADFLADAQQCHRAAVIQTVIDIFRIRILNPEITARQGDIRFDSFDLNTHYAGNGFSHFRTGGHACIGCRKTGNDGLRILAATRQPAAASIGAGQLFFNR